jgi:hypothetical protein
MWLLAIALIIEAIVYYLVGNYSIMFAVSIISFVVWMVSARFQYLACMNLSFGDNKKQPWVLCFLVLMAGFIPMQAVSTIFYVDISNTLIIATPIIASFVPFILAREYTA